jgi:hypothetical protein
MASAPRVWNSPVRRPNCVSSARSRGCASSSVPLKVLPGKCVRLAPGGQHAAGEPGAAAHLPFRCALVHLDRRAAVRELERAAEACYAGADDRDPHRQLTFTTFAASAGT